MRSLSCATLVVAGVYIVILYLSASLLVTQDVVGNENRFFNGPVISVPQKFSRAARTVEKNKRWVSRFPEYNSLEFSKQCGWALPNSSITRNCTFLVRPTSNDGEGISLWVSLIAQAHQLAQQAQCNLVFDYGPGIDVSSVLSPSSSWNWTVPTNFQCRDRCYHWLSPSRSPRVSLETISKQEGQPVATVPLYRYAYNFKNLRFLQLYQDEFAGIQRNMPGFVPEIGMACSLTSLFRLSPDSSQFVLHLFTKILPTLRDEDSLVMSLYIRTLQADKAFNDEKRNHTNPYREDTSYRNQSLDIINCAIQQETSYIENKNASFSRVVWLVVSDSKDLKQWIAETYTDESGGIPRQVIVTTARGVHSRSDRGPSQSDFAEAMVDWYLIGESDLVVMDKSSVSFGGTAALRTARPVQDASDGKCIRAIPIREGQKPHRTINNKK